MHKFFLVTAAVLGAVSVALGAFGAHGLRDKISADALNIYETAVKYQFYHVFALLAVGMLFQQFPGTALIWSGRLFLFGMLLFSGSLYALTFFKASGNTSMNWLGAVTPLGGLCFIGGWILMAAAVWKK